MRASQWSAHISAAKLLRFVLLCRYNHLRKSDVDHCAPCGQYHCQFFQEFSQASQTDRECRRRHTCIAKGKYGQAGKRYEPLAFVREDVHFCIHTILLQEVAHNRSILFGSPGSASFLRRRAGLIWPPSLAARCPASKGPDGDGIPCPYLFKNTSARGRSSLFPSCCIVSHKPQSSGYRCLRAAPFLAPLEQQLGHS